MSVFGSLSDWITKGVQDGDPFATASAAVLMPVFALFNSL